VARAQTADDVTKLLARFNDLNTLDLGKLGVKYRAGLAPSLAAVDADESAMKVLKDPHEAQGQGKPGAVGWYRVSFDLPEKIGKTTTSASWVVETNVQGIAEIYTYRNGKPTGVGNGLTTSFGLPANAWTKSTLVDAKPGDRITLVILATCNPWGRGSPEGFALRHLRLGKRTSPVYSYLVDALFNVREKLRTAKGDELKALQEKVKGPMADVEAVFAAAETGNANAFIEAVGKSANQLNKAIRK